MPRPAEGYKLADGTRVPGVSTIASVAKDSGALVHWAWELGQRGVDYRQVRDSAADAGTLAHAAVDAWVRNEPFTFDGPPDVVGRAKRAFDAFLEWAGQSRLVVTHSEVTIISESLRVGGTLDAMLINGRRALGDWKSSAGIYLENMIQIAGYGVLWSEAHPEEPIDGGFHLIRFDKVHGDFAHRWWGDLSDAREAFVLCRRLYDLRVVLKQRCR
jgi:hypothetical protein